MTDWNELRRRLAFLVAAEPYLVLPLVVLPILVPNPWRPALAALTLALLLLRWLVLGYPARRTGLEIPIALALAGATVGAAVSPYPEMAIEWLWGYFGAVALFYLIATHRTEANLRSYLALLGIASSIALLWLATRLIEAPVGAANAGLAGGRWYQPLVGALFPVISRPPNPNGTASLLVVALPLTLAGGLCGRGLTRVALLLAAALLAIGVLSAGNEGGKLALAAGAVGVLSAWFRRPLLAFSVLALPPALLLLGWLGPQSAGGVSVFGPSALSRLERWRFCFDLILSSPLTGIGPGVFRVDYQRLFGGDPTYFSPHNAFLQTYLDAGPLGLLGLLWFVVAGVRASFVPPAAKGWAGSSLRFGIAGAWLAYAVSASFEASSTLLWTDSAGVYHSILSPLPWLLAALATALHPPPASAAK